MSRAAVKKVRGRAFTAEEFIDVAPDEMKDALTVEALRPVLDELVDSGDLKVTLVGDELHYRVAKARTFGILVERVAELAPDAETVTQNVALVPTVGLLLDRARADHGAGFVGLRQVVASRAELEAARDELIEVLRCLNLPTARDREGNAAPRAWAEEMLREIRHALRNTLNGNAQDTLCVTCRARQRHFGEYCKRCCPPDERPHGKVS